MIKSNHNYIIVIIIVTFFISTSAFAQVGIGTSTPNSNAMLDIDVSSLATDAKKGFMPPRMTTVEKSGMGLGTDDKGMLVFDTTLTAFYYWDGTQWLLIRIDTVVTDSDSLGNIYLTQVGAVTLTLSSPKKILGTTASLNLVNFITGGESNRLVYDGNQTSKFSFVCSLSFNGYSNSNNDVYSFYIAKGSPTLTTAVLPSTKVDRYVSIGSDVGALSISGTVELEPGQWIEIWAENNDDDNGLEINNFNLLIQSIK